MRTISMRAFFAESIYQEMTKNQNICVLVGDFGYKMWDNVRRDFPDRFLNTGAAEQAMLDIAVGLALGGKIPVVYTATPFLLYRPFESLRNYLNHEKIPVKLIGSGREKDYLSEGFSHWADEDKKIMKLFSNIIATWPEKEEEIPGIITKMLNDQNAWYVNLRR